jgi:hypothetical protein
MYKSWGKWVYSPSFCIDYEGANLVFEQIYSHCRWITRETLRHRGARHSIICKMYGTKEFTQKF